MGGDHGPSITIPAAISFVKHEPEAELILVGLEEIIRAELMGHDDPDADLYRVRRRGS